MIAVQILLITGTATATLVLGARRLDQHEQQENHEYELRDARARAIRAELDILNDGSWLAYWQEMRDRQYGQLVAAAAWELHGIPDDVVPGLVWEAA